MKLELHIYDINHNLITSNYNVPNWRLSNSGKQLIYNIHNEVRRLGFKSGRFNHELFLYDLILGSTTRKQIYISQISSDRTELKIVPNLKNTPTQDDLLIYNNFIKLLNVFESNYSNKKTTSINLGKNITIDINNWMQDKVTVLDYPYGILIKLDTPLPAEYEVGTNIAFLTKLYYPINYNFQLIPSNQQYDVNILNRPNFNLKINSTTGIQTSYQSWNDLLSADTEIKNLLINQFFNFYDNSARLNVDYTDYVNFVFYSNAEIRLYNFKYKLKQIQTLESLYNAVGIQTFKDKYLTEIEDIKNNFDGYDYFLYYTVDTTYSWPKDTNDKPLDINDSISISWYESQILIARDFDKHNIYALSKKIPAEIGNDEFNSQFILFINMIGQHFDILWLYTNNIDTLRDRDELLTSGMSKDLIYHVLSNFGWNPQHDNQFDELWQYILGEVEDESGDDITVYKATTENIPREDITKEIWKRILNNLPYIWKTKGSEESVRALINCVSGDTQVNTEDGLFYVKDLVGKQVKTLSKDGIFRTATWNYYGKQKLYKIILENGDILRATADHNWFVTKNGKRNEFNAFPTLKLKNERIPIYPIHNFVYNDQEWLEGVQRGLIYGDGSVAYKGCHLDQFGDSRHLLLDYFEDVRKARFKSDLEGRYWVGGAHKYPIELKTELPTITQYSRSYIRGFLAGFIAADGCVDKDGYTTLHQNNYDILIKIRELSNYVGLPTTNIKTRTFISNLTNKECTLYHLCFYKVGMYDDKMVLKNKHKDNMFNSSKPFKTPTIKVIDIIEDDIEDVYCCVEPETHSWVTAQGYLTSNCFGIPRTELHIREYGGPNKLDVKSQLYVDKFNYCIKLETGNKIVVPYLAPGTIEFRFKLLDKSNQTIFIREDNYIALNFIYTSNNNGRIQYYVNSGSFNYISDEFPIYDERWWSFMFRNDNTYVSGSQYDIFVKHADYNKITFAYSGSFVVTGSSIINEIDNEDYDYFIGLTGRLQEFRYWNIPLTETSFNNHVLAPTAYNGNSETSSYYNLLFRLPLGTDTNRYNHYNIISLNSQHPAVGIFNEDCIIDGGYALLVPSESVDCNSADFTSSFTYIDGGNAYSIYCNDAISASFIGFDNEYNYELVREQYTYEWPDLSANRSISNKIRIENNVLESNLSISNRAEKAAYDLYPIDNAKIGVYLSTTNEVDEDIAEHMAAVNIDDYIGTIDSEFRSEYPNLRKLKDYYYQQYIELYNVKDYFQLLKYFSNSLFKHIDDLTPARSNKMTGLVVEPHILNRSKNILIKNKPTITNIDYNSTLNITNDIDLTDSSFITYESTLDIDINSRLNGETYLLEGELAYNLGKSRYSWNNLEFDVTGSAILVPNPYWERESVVTVLETYRHSERLEIINPLNTLPSQSYYMKAEIQDYKSKGLKNLYYLGCKISATAINQNSSQTPDGGPIIQSWINDDSNIVTDSKNYR